MKGLFNNDGGGRRDRTAGTGLRTQGTSQPVSSDGVRACVMPKASAYAPMSYTVLLMAGLQEMQTTASFCAADQRREEPWRRLGPEQDLQVSGIRLPLPLACKGDSARNGRLRRSRHCCRLQQLGHVVEERDAPFDLDALDRAWPIISQTGLATKGGPRLCQGGSNSLTVGSSPPLRDRCAVRVCTFLDWAPPRSLTHDSVLAANEFGSGVERAVTPRWCAQPLAGMGCP